jgi:hypothetical protein
MRVRIASGIVPVAAALPVALSAWLCVALAPSRATALPDLRVREDLLETQWVIRDEELSPTDCSVIEGDIQPGVRRLLRFTVGVANTGDEDLRVGDPRHSIESEDGLFEFADCHEHYHFRNYAVYELVDPSSGKTWRAAKRGFCMVDTDPNPSSWGQAAQAAGFRECGSPDQPGDQGISRGWTDTYRFDLGGQYIVLDGGDGQDPVPPGRYILRITANPPYAPSDDDPCRFPRGDVCHAIEESDYTNNVAQIHLEIPARVGRGGVGPLAAPVRGPEH